MPINEPIEPNIFLNAAKSVLEHGFWREDYKSRLLACYAATFSDDVLKDWYVADIVIVKDDIIASWKPRKFIISDDEFEKTYGRKPNYTKK